MKIRAAAIPPIWLIAPFTIQLLVTIWLLCIGLAFSGSQLTAFDVITYAIPLLFVIASGSASWWLWASGMQRYAVAMTVCAPLLLFAALFIVLGVGL